MQIKRLEDLVSQPLIERGKIVRLTSAGEMVRSYAIDMLKLNDSLVRDIRNAKENVVIRLGTPDDYAKLILPTIVREFARNNSNIECQIVSDLSINLAKYVEDGSLDIAFITWNTAVSGLTVVEEPLTWVASIKSEIKLQDPVPLAVFPEGCRVRELAMRALEDSGKKYRVAYSSNQFAPLHAAIAAGDAVGVLPSRAVPKEILRVGGEYGLPELPKVALVLKVSVNAVDGAHRLASAIAQAFRPTVFG